MKTINNVHQEKYRITVSQSDAHDRLTARDMLMMLQNTATTHSKIMGLGWHVLDEMSILYVLIRMRVEFVDTIRNNDDIEIQSWPTQPNRFFSMRYFDIVNNGRIVARAGSKWCLLDTATRSIVNPNKLYHIFDNFSTRNNGMEMDSCKQTLDDSYDFAYSRLVRFSDIDCNGHVNNTKYIEYFIDALTEEYCHKDIASIDIEYRRECRLGDPIDIYIKSNMNTLYFIALSSGEICSAARVEVHQQTT